MSNRPLLYIIIQPEVIILLYQRRNSNMFKALQCISRKMWVVEEFYVTHYRTVDIHVQ